MNEVKQALIMRLRSSALRPGARFLSARELSAAYGVSYQTAHRLLEELGTEGLVERRAAAGTYVPGGAASDGPDSSGRLTDVFLIFSERARRSGSFGAHLLTELTVRLRRSGIDWEVRWAETLSPLEIPANVFPVLWEAPTALASCLRSANRALLLNALPAAGLGAVTIDSVGVDNYFGGACAADILLAQASPENLIVVSGPEEDARSRARRDGFLSRAPGATVVSARGWYAENGFQAAPDALRREPAGLFCANDRLAEGVLLYTERMRLPRPRLVGFDDAPVAAVRDLTTLAIPWDELASDAAEIISRRLSGDVSAARQQIVIPQVVLRRL